MNTLRRKSFLPVSLPLYLVGALLLGACQTIPYNEKVASTVAAYGTAADRHIVAVGTAWQTCLDTMSDGDRKTDRTGIRYDVLQAGLLAFTETETLNDAVALVMQENDIVAAITPYLVGARDQDDLKAILLGYAGLGARQPTLTPAERNTLVAAEIANKIAAGAALRNGCAGAAYKNFAATFYDNWSSKLFTTQQQAAAGDIFGLCAKAGEQAKKYAAKIADAAMKDALSRMRFDDSKSCTLGTIGGVIIQHENLRALHERRIVIDRDNGKFWRETVAQSVRIALTVENFKKSAADDSGSAF